MKDVGIIGIDLGKTSVRARSFTQVVSRGWLELAEVALAPIGKIERGPRP